MHQFSCAEEHKKRGSSFWSRRARIKMKGYFFHAIWTPAPKSLILYNTTTFSVWSWLVLTIYHFFVSLLMALVLTSLLYIKAYRDTRSNLPKQPCILGHSSNGTGENRELIRPSESSQLPLYMLWIPISVEINNRKPILAESTTYFEADFTAAVSASWFFVMSRSQTRKKWIYKNGGWREKELYNQYKLNFGWKACWSTVDVGLSSKRSGTPCNLHSQPGSKPTSHVFYPFKVWEWIQMVLALRPLIVPFTR